MSVDPLTLLEVTLGKSSNSEAQPTEDPLHINSETDIQPLPSTPLFGFNELNPVDKVITNSEKLTTISQEEMKFRRSLFADISSIVRNRIHCTTCDVHIGCHPGLVEADITHPLLKVLSCTNCVQKYKYVDFPLGPNGQDVRCRWCTSPESESCTLHFCFQCPFAFCANCLKKNVGDPKSRQTSICPVCHLFLIWRPRAMLWALIMHVQWTMSAYGNWQHDLTHCCKIYKKRKEKTQPIPRNNISARPIVNGNENAAMQLYLSNQSKQYQKYLETTIINDLQQSQQQQSQQQQQLQQQQEEQLQQQQEQSQQQMQIEHQSKLQQILLLQSDKLFIETAPIKDKLASISLILCKMNDLIISTASEMDTYCRCDNIKTKVENLAAFIGFRTEQLLGTCHTMTTELAARLMQGRGLTGDKEINKDKFVSLPNEKQQQIFQFPTQPSHITFGQIPTQIAGLSKDNTVATTDSNGIIILNRVHEGVVYIDNVQRNQNPIAAIDQPQNGISNNNSNSNNSNDKNNNKPRAIRPKKNPQPKPPKRIQKFSKPSPALKKKLSQTLKQVSEELSSKNNIPLKECYVKLTRITVPCD